MSSDKNPRKGYALAVPEGLPGDPVRWAKDAQAQLAACCDLVQVREMAAQAQGILAYLNAKLGRASEEARAVAELEVLTRRRIGELLPPAQQKGGDRKSKQAQQESTPDLGVDHRRASEARRLASVPQGALLAYLEKQRQAGKPPSVNGALKHRDVKPEKSKPRDDDPAQREAYEQFDPGIGGPVRIGAGAEVLREIYRSVERAKAACDRAVVQLRRNKDGHNAAKFEEISNLTLLRVLWQYEAEIKRAESGEDWP